MHRPTATINRWKRHQDLYVSRIPGTLYATEQKNEFHYQPDWYRGIEYPKEQERGYDFNEDLYVPGYFEVDIKKGESIVFSAGISEISPRKLKQTFEAEAEDRTPRDSFYHCLKIRPTNSITNKERSIIYLQATPGSSVVHATCLFLCPA